MAKVGVWLVGAQERPASRSLASCGLDYLDEAISIVSEQVEEILALSRMTAHAWTLSSGCGAGPREPSSPSSASRWTDSSDRHLASWAGPCPGNNESAGKTQVRPYVEGELLAAGGAHRGRSWGSGPRQCVCRTLPADRAPSRSQEGRGRRRLRPAAYGTYAPLRHRSARTPRLPRDNARTRGLNARRSIF